MLPGLTFTFSLLVLDCFQFFLKPVFIFLTTPAAFAHPDLLEKCLLLSHAGAVSHGLVTGRHRYDFARLQVYDEHSESIRND